MSERSFFLLSWCIFTVVAALHLARILFGWQVVIDGVTLPMGYSLLAVCGAGYLSFTALQLGRRR